MARLRRFSHQFKDDDNLGTPERVAIKELYSRLRIIPQPVDFQCVHLCSCSNSAKLPLITGTWAYVGTQYGKALIKGRPTKILFVSMDRGGSPEDDGWPEADKETFAQAQYAFRHGAETPHNAHMRGVHLILSELLDEKEPSGFSRQYALTNAVKCAQKTGTMQTSVTPQMIANCASWLFEEIAMLRPDLIISQGRHPADTLKHSAYFRSKESVAVFRGDPKGHAEVFRVEDPRCVLLITPHPARLKDLSFARRELPAFLRDGIQCAIATFSSLIPISN